VDHLTRSESLKPNLTLDCDTIGQASFQAAQAEPVKGYVFVDNVRFLSMAAVVALHCIGGACSYAGFGPSDLLPLALLQPFKFGTIGFFLISGFLMGEGLTRRSPRQYMARRLRTVFRPWLLWFSTFCALSLTANSLHHRIHFDSWSVGALLVLSKIHDCLFFFAYWFVPNLLIAIAILLVCRRFLFDLRIGCVFLTASLFYGINIYTHWIPIQSHTEAVFGFVFYLWLGALAARHKAEFETWIVRIPIATIVALAGLTGLIALLESVVLAKAGVADAMDTLRISNQVFSILVVLAIFKVRKNLWPRAMDVRSTTFGIYLAHTIVLVVMLHLPEWVVSLFFTLNGLASKLIAEILVASVFFTVTYGCSWALTAWLVRHESLCWTVGFGAPGRIVQDTTRRGAEDTVSKIRHAAMTQALLTGREGRLPIQES